jgi:TPR repeat protein
MQAFTRGDYAHVLRTALPHAITGNSEAQCMVSLLYQNGFGVTKDLAEAERWLLKAAEQDNPVAWNNLGTLYTMGGARLVGGPERAYDCYQRAKELGFDCAKPLSTRAQS